MGALKKHIGNLEAWLRSNYPEAHWEGILIGEEKEIFPEGSQEPNTNVPLFTLEEYEQTFTTLLESGYSWLNLSAVGVLNNYLIVCLEKPFSTSGVAKGLTSVNLSGSASKL